MIENNLRKKILKIPSKPGIYVFKGIKNKSLYIGKALNLKNRVKHYLKTSDTRLQKMMSESKKLDHIETKSEIEALILESQYIKKHQPKNHKETIGPFTDAGALKTTLRLLRRIFPYCTCKQLHNNYCLNYHIGKCLGYCCLKNSHNLPVRTNYKNLAYNPLHNMKRYQSNIGAIRDILDGKKVSLVKNLKGKMGQLAQKGELEKAIELRNKITDVERIFKNAKIIKNSDILKEHISELQSLLKLKKPIIRIEGYDVSNIQGAHATGAMVVFTNGKPDKNQYRKFKIQFTSHHDRSMLSDNKLGDTGMLREILERRFRHVEWPFPDLIIVDGGKQQLRAVEAVANPKQIPIIAVTKNKKHIGEKIYISGRKTPILLTKLPSADRNLLLQIDSEAHRFAIGYYRKLHAKLFK